MIQGLLLKEWIKTRWTILVLTLVGLGATIYALLTMQRVINLRGVEHLWIILLSKDVLFVEAIKLIPLLSGLVLAVVQFAPEMIQKRLKLTLHLPVAENTIATTMLTYGLGVLLVLSGLEALILTVYLSSVLAPELVEHIMVSVLPWLMAGLAAYGLTSLIVLEPTWRRRILYGVMSYGVLSLYFISSTPRFYEDALLPMALVTLLLCYFSFLSISRFKEGVQ